MAQYDYYGIETKEPMWNIHAGPAFLTGDTKDDSTWVVGIEGERPLAGRTDTNLTLGVDWIPIDTNTTGREHVVPVLIGIKTYRPVSGYKAFFGAAVGTRWASEDIPELRIEDGFRFGWGAGAGINISPDFLAQVRFLGGSHPSDDGAWTIELGYRF